MGLPFFIKICGVRDLADIESVRRAGGDAVGINFFPGSVRHVDSERAAQLTGAAVAQRVLPIGLFVNKDVDHVIEQARQVGLNWVQLHGDEPPAMAGQLRGSGLQVLRAVRLPAGPLDAETIDRRVQPWHAAGCAILLDAAPGSGYGGQGVALDWDSIRRWSDGRSGLPFVLAGGLRPDNVAQAIATSGASAVDVASGVEAPRGVKADAKIRIFCAQASGHLYRSDNPPGSTGSGA